MSALAILAEALDRLEIAFVVGGSLASSAHGAPRTTYDADLVVRINSQQLDELAECLGPGWYFDVEFARRALQRGQSFNILHMGTVYKFDLFPANTAFRNVEISRATIETVFFEGETIECPVATAEDILLAKLRWYADGGEASEKHWSDIVMVVQANRKLDREYVAGWAEKMGVEKLLDRAYRDSTL